MPVPLLCFPLSLSLHSLRLILFLTPIQCSIAVVIASKCLNAFIVASSQLPRSLPPHPPFVWLPLSFSFFQVVVVAAAAACPTCVVVIDLSLMGGSRCRLRLPQRREMWQREKEGGACRQRDAVEQPLVLLLLLQHAPGQETIDICLSQRRIGMQQQQTL